MLTRSHLVAFRTARVFGVQAEYALTADGAKHLAISIDG